MNAALDRAIAAYLGLAIGDALGATVEFMTPREIAAQYKVHDTLRGGGWLNLKRGQVTDDTTMALALGDAILAHGRVLALPAAQAFDAWMRAKPVDIGNTVRRGLLRFRETGQTEMLECEHAAGNGAAMRVLPAVLATLNQPEEVVRLACRTQAHITHNNPLSDAGTECLALMVRDAIGGADKVRLLHERAHPLARLHTEFTFRAVRQQANPSGYIADTVVAVFQALFDTDDLETCLVDVVNRGGDADTTGAIAGMLAGALYGLSAIPERWLNALDPAIRKACEEQAEALVRLT
ncbi:MAG: ADP-ribosyl-[dinitrogen reductase] hydrolase [Gallionellaceae bacterium]|nr:ADP-ribosyl-[dinitrogen reductase] hydrolase [Gallionellaceae bacterium]